MERKRRNNILVFASGHLVSAYPKLVPSSGGPRRLSSFTFFFSRTIRIKIICPCRLILLRPSSLWRYQDDFGHQPPLLQFLTCMNKERYDGHHHRVPVDAL